MFLWLYFYLIAPIAALLAISIFRKKIKLRLVLALSAAIILLISVLYLPLRHHKVFIHKYDHNGRTITSTNDQLDLIFTFPRTVERDLRFNMVQLMIELPFLLAIYFTTVLIIVETIGVLIVPRKISSQT